MLRHVPGSARGFIWGIIGICLPTVFPCTASADAEPKGIVFNSSRVIFLDTQNNASIEVRNETDVPRLMAAGIRTLSPDGLQDGGRSEDFLCAPSVSILDKRAISPIRIVRANRNLPKDRESLYLLRVHLVPQTNPMPEDKGTAQVFTVLTTYLKMVYRPAVLEVQKAVEHAATKVTYRLESGFLILVNPTPYWLTLSEVAVDGENLLKKEARKPLLAPKTGKLILSDAPLSGSPQHVAIRVITDRGVVSDRIAIGSFH